MTSGAMTESAAQVLAEALRKGDAHICEGCIGDAPLESATDALAASPELAAVLELGLAWAALRAVIPPGAEPRLVGIEEDGLGWEASVRLVEPVNGMHVLSSALRGHGEVAPHETEVKALRALTEKLESNR